jgi:hypothetical protein
VLGAENLRGKVDNEQGELEPLIRDERRQLRNELEERYGKWVKWSSTSEGDGVRMRRITVDPDIGAVKDRIGKDTTYIGDEIVNRVRDNKGGIRVESLLNDFLQFRRLPVLLGEEVFRSTVRKLQRNGKVVLEGDRANFYVGDAGQYPSSIEDRMTIHHPDNLPESVFEEDDGGSRDGDDSSTGLGGTDWKTEATDTTDDSDSGSETDGSPDEVVEPEDPETVTETLEVSLEGNSSRVLGSTAETRLNERTDTIEHIRLSYDVGELSKSELLEFIERLPDGEHIDATVVIERDSDE